MVVRFELLTSSVSVSMMIRLPAGPTMTSSLNRRFRSVTGGTKGEKENLQM